MKKKIAIIVGNDVIARNYIVTNAFEGIERKFNCTEYVNEQTLGIEERGKLFEGNDSKKYVLSKTLQMLSQLMNDVNMYKQINKSRSFKYRIERKLKPNKTQRVKTLKQLRERMNLLIYRMTAYYISKHGILQKVVKKF